MLWLVLACLVAALAGGEATGQSPVDGSRAPAGAIRSDEAASYLPPTRTDSPRQTLTSFIRLRDALEKALRDYGESHTAKNAERVSILVDEMRTLFDTSQVPIAARREVSGDTVAYVLDILGRVGLPNLDTVPDLTEVEADNIQHYAVPEAPFRIVRIDEGPRTGEFVFSAETIQTAPRFFRGIERLPLQSSVPMKSWIDTSRQLTGPLIPASLVLALPESLKQPAFGTPIWKIASAVLIFAVAALVLAGVHRAVTSRRSAAHGPIFWRRSLTPIAILACTFGVWSFVTRQMNVSGQFALAVDVAAAILGYMALAWMTWLGSLAIFESIVRRSDFPEENLDANLLRLVARIIGVIGVVIVLATGAQAMGLPVVSVLAGLGIGGLAVALAIRPTLENLIGGFILYLDKPIRVGDFCSFGTQSGTIESIGVRSTQIRALDRTLITVPNAQFADMQIVNWAQCDQMLIQQTIGLRYETDGDQLRYVLGKMREMFHAHPRVDSDTIRVRFAGYGASSLDIMIRVYARTREWNDFFAIKEDLLFRIKEIVEQSGTGFAFPSQTLYLGRDAGIDAALSDKAQKEVAAWRRAGRLPFPRFPAGILERITGTLAYPPRGSPDFHAGEEEEEIARPGSEPLSAIPPEPVPKPEQPSREDAAKAGEPERA